MTVKKSATPKKPTPTKSQAAKRTLTPAQKRKAAAKRKATLEAKKKTGATKAQGSFEFPKGNKWWQCRAKHGRNGIWQDPEALLKDCLAYFEWLEKNPFLEDQRLVVKGNLKGYNKKRMRPATIHGLRIHLGIGQTTWQEYRKRPDFMVVCQFIEDAIYEQKFAGAAAGFLNAQIIARDLGLKDSIAAEVTGAGGGPVQVTYKGVSSDGKRRN